MPIYEYECKKCGTVAEVIQKISDPPLKKCESNGCKGKMRRLVSNTSFVLKGSGWYVTDYPSDSRKKGMESENKSNGSSSDNGKKTAKPKASGKEKKASTSTKADSKTVSAN